MAVLQDININVHGQPSEKRLQTFLRLSQNENGRLISFRVLGPPLPSNCTATFSGTKPDGNVYSKTGTVTGNFVIIEEDIQMTAVAGVWDAKLDIINGTHNIMTALIRVVVDADVVDPDAIASDSQLQGLVAETKYYAEHARTDAYGSPLTAPTKAQMTDHTRVYVYTGSEPNMVAGNWYLWNGSAWVSGGVYNAVAVQTDTTLSVAGKAADGKATGDALDALKEDLNSEISARESAVSAETARAEAEEARIEALFTGDVSEAVNDWLDEHPEATTTVQDGSLTEEKFSDALKLKTVKDYVTPDMFGAVGDGETDDTTAVKGAMDYAIANNCAVFIPQKTYIITPTLSFSLAEGQSLVVFGAGQKSCLKRKADSLTNKWQRMILVNPSSAMTAHAGDVIFSNFFIDSNRRNQSNATSDYTYEAAADICIANGTGTYDASYQYIERVIIDRMVFFDPVADCFNFSGSGQVYVKNIWIDGMVATGRRGTRNDIGFTGNPLGDVWIQNCNVGTIHFEYNNNSFSDENIITYHFMNCVCRDFTLGGKFNLLASGLHAKFIILNRHRYARLTNCLFDLKMDDSYLYFDGTNNKTVFDGCTFIHHYTVVEGGTNKKSGLYIRDYANVDFINCDFVLKGDLNLDIDGDGTNDHADISAMFNQHAKETIINVDGCRFDSRFKYIIDVSAGTTITVSNVLVKTAYLFYLSLLSTSYQTRIDLHNVVLTEDCWRSLYVSAINQSSFIINGAIKALFKNFVFAGANTTAYNNMLSKNTGDLHFVVDISEPLSIDLIKSFYRLPNSSSVFQLIKGTTFRGVFAEAPNKWIVKNSEAITGNTQAVYQNKFKLIGTGTGDIASRPTCILDKGFQYFDTDLGKVIVWNGTTWVNVDGTALSA